MRKITFVKYLSKLIVSEDTRKSDYDHVQFIVSQIEIVDSQGNVLSPARGSGRIPNGTEVLLVLLASIAILCIVTYCIIIFR